MKKIAKIVTVIVALALCLFCSYTPVTINHLAKLFAAETQSFDFAAPTQSSNKFISEAVDTYDLANWSKPDDSSLLSQKVTSTDTKHGDPLYSQTTLSSAELNGRTPYVIANENNKRGQGCYTTDAITLPANGYYMVEVEYCLKSQTDAQTAFGTFYLNNRALLLKANGWHFAAFYIHTDLLETASIKPELYLGSRDELSAGSIYFNKFTITAVNADKFQTTVFDGNNLKVPLDSYIDFANTNAYTLVQAFNNDQFSDSNDNGAYNTVTASNIPGWLGFNDEQHYFYTKDGSTNNSVMLIEAENGNATLNLDYTLQPQPHEVYMFQFYSIATAGSEFTGFCLNINPTQETIDNNSKITASSHQIATLTSDKYHNGWQLNTVFLITGRDLFQAYQLSFSLAKSGENATGWACIDDFRIYKVSGDYAENNASSAVGVHDTYDMNQDTEPDIANAYFELGTSATITTSTYPYPLKAKSWTSDAITGTENGIVNLAKWNGNFGTNPGLVSDSSYANNNVYMMHNSTRKHNTLISPAITFTAGETTRIAFDACSNPGNETRAWIITGTTDDNGNLSEPYTYLGNAIDINEGRWQHYEFTINENKYAGSRSYYLLFTMDGTDCYAYIDNVTKPSQADNTALTSEIDLTNPLSLDTIWESSDENVTPLFTNNHLTVKNENGNQTTIKNTFAYNLTQGVYYEFIINALGNNAYLSLTGYEGLLPVNTEDETNYKLYLKVADNITPSFQIMLGSTDENANNVIGEVSINSITVNEITEADYDDAKETADLEGAHKLFLTESTDTDEDNTDNENTAPEDNSFFGQNWWYLIPTLITAIAALLAITAFLLRKIKFEKHITKKHTSYARDMRLKNQHNKIVAQKAAKVDNVTNETHSN